MMLARNRKDRTPQTLVSTTIVAILLAPTPALAWQQTWRNLTGTVTDGHHEPLRGAVIQVHNEATDSVLSYITGRTGKYTFKRLDANADYDITATFQGHKSKRKEISHFDAKEDKVLDLKVRMQ